MGINFIIACRQNTDRVQMFHFLFIQTFFFDTLFIQIFVAWVIKSWYICISQNTLWYVIAHFFHLSSQDRTIYLWYVHTLGSYSFWTYLFFFLTKKKAIFLSRLFLFFFQFFDAISKISTYTLLFFLVKLAHCLILELLKAFMYVLLLSLGNSMSSSKKKR